MKRLIWIVGLFFLWTPLASAHHIPIAIVSSGYGDMTRFESDAQQVITAILSYEPYKTYADRFTFQTVETTRDLYCAHSPYMDRYLSCNTQQVRTVLADLGVTYTRAIILVNDSNYGGSGESSFAVSYNGSLMTLVATHEFGHTFGGLLDEYVVSAGGSATNVVNKNCWTGSTPPAPTWTTPVGDYRQECYYPVWWRSSDCSLMRSLSCPWFNSVSQALIEKQILFYGGEVVVPGYDQVAPTVQIVSPLAETVVKGKVPVRVEAQDNVGIEHIDFYTTHLPTNYTRLRKTSTTSPLTWTWNVWSKSYKPGRYRLTAEAFDGQGNKTVTTTEVTK